MKRPPEMSRRQFADALKRNGFRQTLLWISDTTGEVPGTSWGIVMHHNGKVARRATLAKVIREREAEIAKKAVQSRLSPEDDAVLFATGHLPEDF